ncbi:multiheme c-type cytochrome [Leptospira sp. 96542]|nr:multiheme c-type cytochrome [Leptospira sp. 96542]
MRLNRNIISFIGIIVFSAIYIESSGKDGSFDKLDYLGFRKGLEPILYSENVLPLNNKILYRSSKDCKGCHKQIYTNWFSSRHRQSHSNRLYQFSFSKEPMDWCENCHAPLRDSMNGQKIHPEEGISCITCHLRNQEIIVTNLPELKETLVHTYKVIQDFNSSKLCESCHDFNFPTWESIKSSKQTIEYSRVSMQGTASEWLTSGMNHESDCIDCHLLPGTKNSHKFPGGHSLKELKDSFTITGRYLSGNTLQINIQSSRIGHAFPTGDLFRALNLKVYGSNGNLLKQFTMSKKYRLTTEFERRTNDSPKILVEDTRIPPPELGKDTANKEFILNIDNFPETLDVELWIDYLHDVDFVLSPIPDSQSKKLILKEKIRIQNRDKLQESDKG